MSISPAPSRPPPRRPELAAYYHLRSTVAGRFWSAQGVKVQVSALTASENRENA